jgi:hypothetical protein
VQSAKYLQAGAGALSMARGIQPALALPTTQQQTIVDGQPLFDCIGRHSERTPFGRDAV